MKRSRIPAIRPVFGLALALALGMTAGAVRAQAPGSKIAFAADTTATGRSSRIFVANADGTGTQLVTAGGGRDRSPAFSPDGKLLAYQATDELGLDVIKIQPLAGGEPRTLAVGMQPQWSRDGSRILFSRRAANDYNLFVIRADGTQKDGTLKPVAKGQIGRWSPDEKQIAAVVPVIMDGKDRWQIQVLPSEKPEPVFRATLPEAYGQVISLEWSPDGERLLFSTARDGRYDLYVMDLKAPEPRRVPQADEAEGIANAAYGAWSPDGKQILFRCSAGAGGSSAAQTRLCVMDADGTNVRVVWQPDQEGTGVFGTAWHREVPVQVAAAPRPDPKPETPSAKPEPPAAVQPAPQPAPPATPPPALPEAPKVLGLPKKLYSTKLFRIGAERSPVSVDLRTATAADFIVSVSLLPLKGWSPRRQGIGITLQLEDGGLYRGTAIYSGGLWGTLQGRKKGGKVQLIDGKKLAKLGRGFDRGFKLTLKRTGKTLSVAVNGQEVASRPVLSSGVKSVSLTLENFDPGMAALNVGSVYLREWGPGEVQAR